MIHSLMQKPSIKTYIALEFITSSYIRTPQDPTSKGDTGGSKIKLIAQHKTRQGKKQVSKAWIVPRLF